MINYLQILEKLSAAGYSSYRLQREKLLPGSTMDRIRRGEPINTTTIDTVCRLCECQPGDLLSWSPDPEPPPD